MQSALIVSRIMNSKDKLEGFLAVDITGRSHMLSLASLPDISNGVTFSNAVYDPGTKTLVGQPLSLTKYPSIDRNFNPLTKGGVCVMYTIQDASSDDIVGAVLFTSLGQRYNASFKKILDIIRTLKPCNFTFDMSRDIPILDLNGKPFESIKMQVKKKTKLTYQSSKVETKDDTDITNVKMEKMIEEMRNEAISVINGTPVLLSVSGMDKVNDSVYLKPANVIFFEAVLHMKTISPYYHCLFEAISRKPVVNFGTLGVTEDSMYYDLSFVASQHTSELVFILIHEMMHIAMQHTTRGIGKIHDLWNIATDLYINTIICRDFGVTYGGDEVVFGNNASNTASVAIKCPEMGVFLESIGEALDLDRDTPESIYERLLKENPQMSGGGGGGDGQGDSGGQSDSGSKQQDSGSGGNNQQNSKNGGSGEQGSNDDFDDGEDKNEEYTGRKEVTVTYNGKKLTGTIMDDVMASDKTDESTRKQDIEKSSDKSKSALQRMKTKVQLTEMETGEKLEKNAGAGGGLVQRHIDFGLADNVDWRVLLRNMCNKDAKKIFTLAMPNTDYMNRGITVAARHRVGKPTKISGVKVCVDVSGSVSEKELNYYLSEVNNIFTYYKVEGELIYWSTEIGDVGDFSDLKSMMKVQPHSTGGTDVKCVFDYLARKVKVNGKQEQTVPRDISCILIITDGCFSHNYAEYEAYFGKKVIWIIDGNAMMFTPPFGRVVSMQQDRDKRRA